MVGYIDKVQAWADPKVVSTLRQFTELHRNPISHPEAVLEDEEATTLVGIVVSAITAMVNDVRAKATQVFRSDILDQSDLHACFGFENRSHFKDSTPDHRLRSAPSRHPQREHKQA